MVEAVAQYQRPGEDVFGFIESQSECGVNQLFADFVIQIEMDIGVVADIGDDRVEQNADQRFVRQRVIDYRDLFFQIFRQGH